MLNLLLHANIFLIINNSLNVTYRGIFSMKKHIKFGPSLLAVVKTHLQQL